MEPTDIGKYVADVLERYGALCDKLHDLYIERAECQAAEVTTRANAYADLCARGDRNITQIREEADHASHRFRADAIKLSGDIDAVLAKLRSFDALLPHLRMGT